MLKKLLEWRKQLATRDISFWEVSPLFVAIVLPNIFDPEWLWRLIAYFIAGVTLLIFGFHALLIPEQFKFPNIRTSKYRKYFFWITYGGTFIAIPFLLFYLVFPVGGDLYRIIKNHKTALEEKVITTIEWNSGGASPFFFLQSFTEENRESYSLPFHFTAWGRGTFEILYSPQTNIIYEIRKAN